MDASSLRPLPAVFRSASLAISAFILLAAAGESEPSLIAIDVGHSTARPGATSARGEPEFAFNRGLALVVERVLRQRGFRTRLIGEQGDFDKLTDRTAAAASAGAAFFLSLHHDSVQPRYLESWRIGGRELKYSDRFSGYSLFVSRGNPASEASLACARAIGEQLRASGYTPSLHHAEPIPGENRPLADASNGIYYFDDLIVLKTAVTPAVLVEAGIILNRDDETTLRQTSTREKLAAAIAEGLQECLGRPFRPIAKSGTSAKP
jgi:N-acetylmuramoyl-L-alanine amidase